MADEGETIGVVAGATERRILVFRSGDGSDLAGYSDSTPLSASLWEGEDRAAIAPGLEVAWTGGGYTRALLTIPGSSTLALAPGTYRALVEVAVGGEPSVAWSGAIEVDGRPGSAAGPYTLCSYRQMLPLYPSIRNLQVEEADLAGFARQRARATAEFLRLVIERYDPRPGMNTRRTATYDRQHGFERQDLATVPPTRAEVQAALVAGGLVLGEPDAATVAAIVGRLAVAEVLERQPGDARGAYGADAVAMRERAVMELDRYRPYVDMNDDGVAEVQVGRDCTFLGDA